MRDLWRFLIVSLATSVGVMAASAQAILAPLDISHTVP